MLVFLAILIPCTVVAILYTVAKYRPTIALAVLAWVAVTITNLQRKRIQKLCQKSADMTTHATSQR